MKLHLELNKKVICWTSMTVLIISVLIGTSILVQATLHNQSRPVNQPEQQYREMLFYKNESIYKKNGTLHKNHTLVSTFKIETRQKNIKSTVLITSSIENDAANNDANISIAIGGVKINFVLNNENIV